MKQLLMNRREYDLWEQEISECVRLLGQKALLSPVETIFNDLYYDKDMVYEDARPIGIIFESNPRPILKKNNWLIEDDELPYVAYIVPLDNFDKPFKVSEQMFIRITSVFGLESTREFVVQRVRGTTIDPLMYICNLTPYRPKLDFKPETEQTDHTESFKTDTATTYLKDFFK